MSPGQYCEWGHLQLVALVLHCPLEVDMSTLALTLIPFCYSRASPWSLGCWRVSQTMETEAVGN